MTTFLKSERLGALLPLGKPPAKAYATDLVAFSDVLKTIPSTLLPPVPQNFGHGLVFGETGWGMDGNGPADPATTKIPAGYVAARNGAGDCFEAGAAHDIRELAAVNGRPVPPISDFTTLKNYGWMTGYKVATGANDNGTNPQQGLAQRQSPGFPDDNGVYHKIGQILTLKPGDLSELFYCAWLLEKAGVGVQFQQAQMDQFDAGQPWSYVSGSSVEGGHWIIVVSRGGLITWGHRGGYVDDWYTNLNDESYGWYDLTEYNAVTGETAEHFHQTDVQKYMTLVAQGKAQTVGLS